MDTSPRLHYLGGVLDSLATHPFAVEAHFRRSLVLAYAVPKDVLAPLAGPGLELDTYEDFGFLAIALVETEALRPSGLPRWMGRDFFLSGYRVFTRFVRPGQPTLRGLKILRSDTDRPAMVRFGNLFTRYRYRLAEVNARVEDGRYDVSIRTPGGEADLEVSAAIDTRPAPLPARSPFRTLEDARRFAGPLPFTFSFDERRGGMVVVKGVRKSWDPQPVTVDVRQATFFDRGTMAGCGARLANAFYLENVAYAWRRGVLEAIA